MYGEQGTSEVSFNDYVAKYWEQAVKTFESPAILDAKLYPHGFCTGDERTAPQTEEIFVFF